MNTITLSNSQIDIIYDAIKVEQLRIKAADYGKDFIPYVALVELADSILNQCPRYKELHDNIDAAIRAGDPDRLKKECDALTEWEREDIEHE